MIRSRTGSTQCDYAAIGTPRTSGKLNMLCKLHRHLNGTTDYAFARPGGNAASIKLRAAVTADALDESVVVERLLDDLGRLKLFARLFRVRHCRQK